MHINKSISIRILITFIILVTALSLDIFFETRPKLALGQAPLKDLQNIETLRTQFNSDVGKTRLIILVSPTWITCLAGARWVQSQLLAQNSSSELRVYAVWLPMRRGDAREAWNGNIMPDERVIHFWDGETEVGQWFAKEVDGYQGTSWDAYYLYGPEAAWDDMPSPLIRSGAIIYDEREAIAGRVSSLTK